MAPTKPSRTAQGALAERALLHERGAIDDPYARSMLTPAMGILYRIARRWPDRIPTLDVTLAGLAARVAWHDAQVRDALDAGVDQVVVVGAGYDSRAWRLRGDGVRFFEVDHGVSQADKIRRAPPGPGPTYVAVDLRAESAIEALHEAGLDPSRRAAFVLEGLTMYLDPGSARDLFADIATAAVPGSRLSTDFYPPPDEGTSAHRRQNRIQRLARAGSGEDLRLTLDRTGAVAFVSDCGWEVTAATGGRDAAEPLGLGTCGLPLDEINPAKTLVAARRPGLSH